MALSEMSPREKTIMIVLGVIIVVAIIGIGLLAARLIAGDGATGGTAEVVQALPTATLEGGMTGETPTLVPAPSLLDAPDQPTPPPVGAEPVVVNRVSSAMPGLPAILANQPLHAGHIYRLEITAQDGSQVAVRGSWSEAASNAQGEISIQPTQVLEGRTPLSRDLASPVPNPSAWSISASVGAADLLGQPLALVITVWDITGSQ